MTTYAPTTTETFEADETRTVHETTWVKGEYTLVRRQISSDKGLSSPRWDIRAEYNLPSIDDTSSWNDEIPVYGVNWSAKGTKTVAEARDYALQIASAATAAEHFSNIVKAESK